jgi:rhodanese-related sulfurtransferase
LGKTTNKSPPLGITNEELYHKLRTKTNLQIMDLRTKNEYDSRHIQGAVWVSSYTKKGTGIVPNIKKSEGEIILVCRDGVQSSQYAKMLSDVGTSSHYLIGGIENWNYSLYHPAYLTK